MTMSPRQLRKLSGLRFVLWFPGRVVTLGLSLALLIHAPAVYAVTSLGLIGWGLSAFVVLYEEFEAADFTRLTAEQRVSEAVAELRLAQARIDNLASELAEARAKQGSDRTDGDTLYRKVGLHPGCPTYVIDAARKGYRLNLHPDRRPEHRKQQAHARFVSAEQIFDDIMSCR